jgi:hypothetical protein
MELRKYVPEPIEVLGIVSLLPSKKDQDAEEQTGTSDGKGCATRKRTFSILDLVHHSLLHDALVYTDTIVALSYLFVNTSCKWGASRRQKEDRRPG